MNIKYYSSALNVMCVCVCVLLVAVYWLQQLTPDIYAALQIFIQSIDPLRPIKNSFDPSNPGDFVQTINYFKAWL